MHRRRRSPTGAPVPAAAAPQGADITFPAGLVHPAQSQVTQYGDAVSQRIAELDHIAQRYGEGFGISFTQFVLNPLPDPANDTGLAIVSATLQSLVHREERISLERRDGRWGLYFTRAPAALAQDRKIESVSLRDAPLDVRERFLLRSEAFFRAYLDLCKDRLSRMKSSIAAADHTLRLLANLRIE